MTRASSSHRRSHRDTRRWSGGARGGRRGGRLLGERARLLAQPAGLSLQLELERLRGLACEPQLAPLRVVAEAFHGHGRYGRCEQFFEWDDGHRPDELGGILPHEHDEAAEPGRACVLEQLEAAGGAVRENGRSAMAERRRHRRLAARLDVRGAQSKRLALFRERAGGGRQPLALVERPLDRDGSPLGKPRLLEEGV